jgi:hypothetical protein
MAAGDYTRREMLEEFKRFATETLPARLGLGAEQREIARAAWEELRRSIDPTDEEVAKRVAALANG